MYRLLVGMKKCSVSDCDGPVEARGWCNKHYLRWRHHGTTDWTSTRKRERPERVCVHPGCGNGSPRITGYCLTHQNRIDQTGSPDTTVNPRFTPFFHMLDEARVYSIESKLTPTGAGCWETWTKTDRTRVNLGHDGERWVYSRVYQVLWAWYHGRDPEGPLDHLCCNPRCCNPNHLEEVTDKENTLRYFRRAVERGTVWNA